MRAIVEYMSQDNPHAARRFVDVLEHSFELFARFPLQSAAFPSDHPELQNLRKGVMTDFRNYLVFYRPLSDGIEVMRVLHGKRDIQTIIEKTHARTKSHT